ncbi:MAG: hypothetical protein WBF90_33620 [Rivularia sp. (in: cyanobacteria)]
MFSLIVEIMRDMLPHKDLPTGAWISRIVSLTLILFAFFYSGYYLIENTEIAKNYGLVKLRKESTLTHVGFTKLVRTTRKDLRKLVGNKASVNVALIVTSYDPKSGLFTLTPNKSDRYIIWEFAAPRNLFLSVNNLEIYFKGANSELKNFATNECVVNMLSANTLEVLEKTVNLNNIDSWLRCPIKSNTTYSTIAHTILFFDSKELSQNGFSDRELISEVWNINEKISELYSYFNTVLVTSD